MRPRVQEVVIDCADPAGLARFWGELLGVRWAPLHPGWAVVEAQPVLLLFQQVPEPKSSPKNRLHLDIQVDEPAAWVARAESLGARRVGEPSLGPDGDGYVVMRDPQDNEFCFVVDNQGGWNAGIRSALDSATAPPD